MLIYMDVYCLICPFDGLSHDRICFEAEAILAIESQCEKGSRVLVTSDVIGYDLFDSMRLAFAEESDADVLLTTDDQSILAAALNFKKANPALWLMEAHNYE